MSSPSYQDDFLTPGSCPATDKVLKQILQIPKKEI
tara:strand:- start:229 stop:333 length:105 start_codon:yes stop_codon:yes gene_type:complete